MLEQKCVCGIMQNCVNDSNCPVTFDAQMNEYHVVSDGRQWMMNYCWWCGGKLSESRRADYFMQPDDGEVQEMRRLLVNTRSIDDVIAALGPPDCRHAALGQIPETLQYSSRWRTLEVMVRKTSGLTEPCKTVISSLVAILEVVRRQKPSITTGEHRGEN